MWNSRSKVDALTPKTTVPWSENQTYLNSRKKLIEKVREKDTNQERGVREREREAVTEFTFSMFL